MDVDEKPEVAIMTNGNKNSGEYTAEDLFSGPAVESPLPTNEPSPPPPITETTLPVPPSVASNVEQAPDVTKPSLIEPSINSTTSLPQQPQPPVLHTPSPVNTKVDVEMTNAPAPPAAPKPVREPPTADEPPAKRLKTEPSTVSNPSKKLPERQHKFLSAALRQLKKQKNATPFAEPVDPVKLNIPKYFDVIKHPMDLSTMENKLNQGKYSTAQQFIDDFHLMINNCVTFNGPDNVITKMGRSLQEFFEKTLKTLPPDQVLS
jgi:bromodomain-containing factor 1